MTTPDLRPSRREQSLLANDPERIRLRDARFAKAQKLGVPMPRNPNPAPDAKPEPKQNLDVKKRAPNVSVDDVKLSEADDAAISEWIADAPSVLGTDPESIVAGLQAWVDEQNEPPSADGTGSAEEGAPLSRSSRHVEVHLADGRRAVFTLSTRELEQFERAKAKGRPINEIGYATTAARSAVQQSTSERDLTRRRVRVLAGGQ